MTSLQEVVALANEALKRVSSAAILQRAKPYVTRGAVVPFPESSIDEKAFRAEVHGTETYDTKVWIGNAGLQGQCDCPHASGGWFCKHQVAVALFWRQRLTGEMPAVDEPVLAAADTKHPRKAGTDRLDDLRRFLASRDAPTLAAKLMELAADDGRIARDLKRWQTLTMAAARHDQLKPAITELLRRRGAFIAWDECRAYVRQAEAVLPLLREAIARDPIDALSLCLHALRLAWKVVEGADDSDGALGDLCQRIGAEWLSALRAAGPRPAKFGDTYLQIVLDDPIGCFDPFAAEEALGSLALARYRSVLAGRWRAAKDAVLAIRATRSGSAAAKRQQVREHASDAEIALWPLERLHLDQLEAAGLVDDVIAVLKEDLATARAWVVLAAYLEDHGRLRDAFAQAEQGLKAYPGDRDLQDVMLQCYERDGWVAEALALHRFRFEQGPDVAGFHAVMEAGRAAKVDVTSLRRELIERVALHEANGSRSSRRDVTLRASILCSEERWKEAYDAARQPAAWCRPDVLRRIARGLPPDHHAAALELLHELLEQAMQRAMTPYRDEHDLVGEIVLRMTPEQRIVWLDRLRFDYKAKRNFIRGLPTA